MSVLGGSEKRYQLRVTKVLAHFVWLRGISNGYETFIGNAGTTTFSGCEGFANDYDG